ncbi:hypothetical protein FOB84_02865 [Gordonia bronchialis]|uniref:hypothetical protein n=1 Tax=Gordonia bronchialis TaxID=2054 RepID=UPI0012DC08DA|nr:hypothetical protein [Gordonia bronchialis]MCC3321513.1 hypothetical protein [Gordonia bronchialis]QGS23273.1 hypothetical protein FOB84_02865 [Gordonia bronchialis]UAK36365.1 hypothetical protein K8O93_13650 [Gordonia bronchialis]
MPRAESEVRDLELLAITIPDHPGAYCGHIAKEDAAGDMLHSGEAGDLGERSQLGQ